MRKIYKKLTKEQKDAGIIFSSCLSTERTEQETDTIHSLKGNEKDYLVQRKRLLNDSFFNDSPFNYNIVRN